VLRFNDGAATFAYRFMPFSSAPGQSFHTENKWGTITIPLSEFKSTADGIEGTGSNAVAMSDVVKSDGKVAFGYRFIAGDTPIEVFNAAFDNFRIIKIR